MSALAEEDLFFSALYGGEMYRWDGRLAQFPLCAPGADDEQVPVFMNVLSGECYLVKAFHAKWQGLSRAIMQILAPPPSDLIMWPVDVINIHNDDRLTGLAPFVGHEYTDKPDSCKQLLQRKKTGGNLALLFPYGECPNVVGAEHFFSRVKGDGWRNPALRGGVLELCRAVQRLNDSGYEYNDIDFSRFFFREDGTVYLDYTDLIHRSAAGPCCSPGEGEYPLEYADPAFTNNVISELDYRSQCYSVCSMAFHLLFERHAYDGKAVYGHSEDNLFNRYTKYRMYQKMPIFIFEEGSEKDNSLGLFDSERSVVDLWEAAPQQVRGCLHEVLREQGAMRANGASDFRLEDFISRLESAQWE